MPGRPGLLFTTNKQRHEFLQHQAGHDCYLVLISKNFCTNLNLHPFLSTVFVYYDSGKLKFSVLHTEGYPGKAKTEEN